MEVFHIRREIPIVIAVIALILLSALSIAFLDDDSDSPIRLRLIGDGIQEIEYGGNLKYSLLVTNTKDSKTNVNLELGQIPEFWNATLSDNHFSLAGDSSSTILLRVLAPPLYASDNHALEAVAHIRVSANGKSTIDTNTILKGTAISFNNDEYRTLESGDMLTSGDLIATIGSPEINIDWQSVSGGEYLGNTTIKLENSHAAILYQEGKAYFAIQDGRVIFSGEGFGGGKRDGKSPLIISRESNIDIDNEFLGFSYSAILIFNPLVIDDYSIEEDALFSFTINDVKPRDDILIEVYKGKLEITNKDDSITLAKSEKTLVERTGSIPNPVTIERIFISLET